MLLLLLLDISTDRAPLTYFNDRGGCPSDFLGIMKDGGNFLGREKNRGIFWGVGD